MYTFILILFIVISIILILLVLIQSSKSSGMELFGSGNQNIFGGQTGDVLSKITSVFAAAFLLCTIFLAVYQAKKTSIVDKKIKEMQQNMQMQQPAAQTETNTGINLTNQ